MFETPLSARHQNWRVLWELLNLIICLLTLTTWQMLQPLINVKVPLH